MVAALVAIIQAGGTALWIEASPRHEVMEAFPVVLLLLGPIVLAVPGRPVFSSVVATASGSAYLAMGYPTVLVLTAAAVALWWTVQDGQLADAALVAAAGWASAVLMSDPRDRDLTLAFVLACAAVVLLAVAESLHSRRDVDQAWQRARDETRDRQAVEIRVGLIRDRQESVAQQASMIEVRAQVAARLVDHAGESAVDEAAAALAAIATTAAGARADVDESLRLLSGETTPVPVRTRGLEELPALIQQWDSVGLLVTVAGAPGRLPAIVDEAAYLVVREALTNVSRHSAASRADVQLVRDGDQLMVTITDPGPARRSRTTRRGTSTAEGVGAGRGLTVLRERVVALGGAVVAGPPRVPSMTSWMVRAVLPAAAVSATGREEARTAFSWAPGHPMPSPVLPEDVLVAPDVDRAAGNAGLDGSGIGAKTCSGAGPGEGPGSVNREADIPETGVPKVDVTEVDVPELDDTPRTHSAQAPALDASQADLELDLFDLLSRRRG